MKWTRKGMELSIAHYTFADYSNPGLIINEALMDPIQQWCWETIPSAKRMSFDTFKFESEADITIFLLMWGG